MNKMPLAILTAILTIFNTSAYAVTVEPAASPQAKDLLFQLIDKSAGTSFNAINHTIINEAAAPGFPSPGDTFVTNGYGVLTPSLFGMELTYSYSIAGTFTGYDREQDKLFFNHGLTVPGVSNQMELYLDSTINPSTLNANESNASSYTDGVKIAVLDIVPTDAGTGFLKASTGTGKDVVTFKLTDSYMEQFGLSENTVLLNKITSDISLIDLVDGQPQAFNFGAFSGSGSGCGGLNKPYDSCAREVGTSEIVLSSVPVPASLGLFLSGFGMLGWLKKRQ